MLASASSSHLLAALQSPLAVAGRDSAVPTGGEPAPGFAELLDGLAVKITAPDPTAAAQERGEPAALTESKTTTDRTGRQAPAHKHQIADGEATPPFPPVAEQPATAPAAASESGNILPVGLPEAAELGDTAASAGTTTPSPLPMLPGAPLPPQAAAREAESVFAAAPSFARPAAIAQQVLAPAKPVAAKPTDKAKVPAPSAEPRPAAGVAITVAAQGQGHVPDTLGALGAEPTTPVRSKPARAADLLRAEPSLPQGAASASAVTPSVEGYASVRAANAPAPAVSAPIAAPTDIDAALDHLVSAREALMPAEAALAIDHAEFGEVSIRFEQSSDGQLSAELAGADPELSRAVTAAIAADRGPAMTADGDTGRSSPSAHQRGSATTGDAATGERGQSGTQSGADRELLQRRAPARSSAREAATDQRPGVFA